MVGSRWGKAVQRPGALAALANPHEMITIKAVRDQAGASAPVS